MPIVRPSQIKNKFWKNPNFLFKPSSNYCAFMLTNQIKSRVFLIVSIFMCFCPFGSSWIGLKMALVLVLSEILQRPTIVWCVKQVDDVHIVPFWVVVLVRVLVGWAWKPKWATVLSKDTILGIWIWCNTVQFLRNCTECNYTTLTHINFYHFHFITLTF